MTRQSRKQYRIVSIAVLLTVFVGSGALAGIGAVEKYHALQISDGDVVLAGIIDPVAGVLAGLRADLRHISSGPASSLRAQTELGGGTAGGEILSPPVVAEDPDLAGQDGTMALLIDRAETGVDPNMVVQVYTSEPTHGQHVVNR